MEFETQTVFGPRTASVDKATALEQLQSHPSYPKGAMIIDIDQKNGQWVAKIKVPKTAAGFPPSDDDGDEGPEPKVPSDNDGDEGPDEGGEKPDSDGDEGGPPKGDGEGGKPKKPSVEEAVSHLTQIVQAIADALGVGAGPGLPGGGPEIPGDVPPPPPGPPGHGGPPPHGGPKGPAEHAMKPGMAPPGTTPVGAPAFASTHPWANLAGKVASFKVTSDPTDQSVAEAWDELDEIASQVGYKATQVKAFKDDGGNRCIKAFIVHKDRIK